MNKTINVKCIHSFIQRSERGSDHKFCVGEEFEAHISDIRDNVFILIENKEIGVSFYVSVHKRTFVRHFNTIKSHLTIDGMSGLEWLSFNIEFMKADNGLIRELIFENNVKEINNDDLIRKINHYLPQTILNTN